MIKKITRSRKLNVERLAILCMRTRVVLKVIHFKL